MAPGAGRGSQMSEVALQRSTEPLFCRRLRLVALLLTAVGVLGIATAVLVAVIPVGPGLDDLLPVGTADVMGQVRDSEGFLVEGAEVTYGAGDVTTVTGETGWYFIEGLETGEVTLEMRADGYKTVVKTVHMERGRYVVDFLAVPGSGSIDVEGEAVPEAGNPGSGKWLMVMGLLVASGLAMAGAVAAHQQRRYPLVILGSVAGIMTWGWFIGSILSVVALIVALPLRREFGRRDMSPEMPWHEPPSTSIDDHREETTDDGALDVVPHKGHQDERRGPGGMPPGRQ